ncbi:ABC transporter substrate-binding protein [Candidatus Epulonipiscium viviparus]|uniref:ABC transporter substrate-binding protein n=1 Tax=Candidatus Epulonipiscium viviparus TaxID=420336 RepID=UPI0027380609|nr:extracellular solute-binding protein [Candidatus Epulopiscium viviparus]
MKTTKLFNSLIGITLVIGTLTACTTPEPVTTDTSSPAPIEAIQDFGGMKITLGNWATKYQGEPEEKASAQDEALWEYRNEMMDKHNFTFEMIGVGRWQDIPELFSTSTMAGEPAASMFRFNASLVGVAKDSGLAYDLATLENFDLDDPKWSQPLREIMTVGDSVYGIAPISRPSKVLFFNKRLFEEAGLDPDLLYDLQASGDWTWDQFMEISQQVTRDTDNDGINDIYAISISSGNFTAAAVFSNGGSYIAKDEDGMFYNNTMSSESLKAFEWANAYYDTGFGTAPERWDGHQDLFVTGKIAMYLGNESEAATRFSTDMTDDYGLVVFPKGPDAENYTALFNDSAFVIPNSFSKDEAEAIAFAYDMWMDPAPGYDGPDDWMAALYPIYRDPRAVEESIALMRSNGVATSDLSILINNAVKTSTAADKIYWNEQTVMEALESQSAIWQVEIDKLNKK